MARRFLLLMLAVCGSTLVLRGQTTFTDDFARTHDYLGEGVAGTIWDGVYLGANEIAQPMGIGMAAGKTSVALASNGVLTITSLQTDWESAADDGFFLFKIVTGDFDMSVEIVGPTDTRAHNFPGLMVRAFGPGGAPAPNDKENYFIWGRFDEYNIANMFKNETDGQKRDRGLGTYPNSNYCLRVQRTGNSFKLYERATAKEDWNQVGSVTRTNFDRPLQVGIEHADYDGGRVLSARYRNFNLTTAELGPFQPAPAPATDLKVETAAGPKLAISWTPGRDSAGSLVMMWTGNSMLKEMPANGVVYQGNPFPLTADTFQAPAGRPPADGYFVAYVGPGAKVEASLLSAPVHVAVFSYVGEGKTITYSRNPARAESPKPNGP